MVGLPYPNPRDPELRERMAFMDGAAPRPSPAAAPAAASPGQQYYSDLCMKVIVSSLTSSPSSFRVQYTVTLTEANPFLTNPRHTNSCSALRDCVSRPQYRQSPSLG